MADKYDTKNDSKSNKASEGIEAEDAEVIDPNAGMLARAAARARSLARSVRQDPDVDMQVGRARALLRRVASKASETVKRIPVDAASDKLMQALSDPRTVQVLQRAMKAAGSAGIQAGFRREPDAKLLFAFAEWCEAATDRGDVMAILMQDALSKDGAFAQLSKPMLEMNAEDPLRAFLAQPPTESLLAVFRSAQYGLMQTLCRLAALGSGVEPPDAEAPQAELIAWFQASAIPEEFKRLMDLVQGKEAPPEEAPDADADADAAAPEEPAHSGATALERLRSALPVRSFPPGFRFLVGTYLVFLHSYLSRNMVDAFPKVMEKVRDDLSQERESQALKAREAGGEVLEMDAETELEKGGEGEG